MALSLVPVQDQITTKLKELPQDVYENGVPSDSQLRFDNGMMLPYIAPFYGSYAQAADGRGIVSTRYDLGESYCIVECVGPNERSARLVADAVRDKLTGFIPEDAGELRPVSRMSTVIPDYTSSPPRYIVEVAFRYAVNVNVVS